MAKIKNLERPKDATRVVHLLEVEGGANNNKYYDMYDMRDGTFIAFYGRVGANPQIEQYPISKWDVKYREKLSSRKGYKDITHLKIETSEHKQFKDVSNPIISKLVGDLQRYANNLISNTYLVGVSAVTFAQITEAQNTINELLRFSNGDADVLKMDDNRYIHSVNNILTHLYTVIPRKMKNVRDHLLKTRDQNTLKHMIVNEQDNLDTMEGQVKASKAQSDNTDDSVTLLDAMGININTVSQDDIKFVKKYLGKDDYRFRNAYLVTNVKTQKRFDNWLNKAKNKDVSYFWHGSRNQNWWPILNSGLVLRPTNAVITGKMFGYGLYFADKAAKSIGYTSLSGSYWARGNESRAFMSLFSVHTGNKYHVKRHHSGLNSFDYNKLKREGDYDSLFAEGGYDLRNNEYIVYTEEQCSVKFLVEIGN